MRYMNAQDAVNIAAYRKKTVRRKYTLKMNKTNEQKIKSASLYIHELFLRNNWTWNIDSFLLIPSTAQIEDNIRHLIGVVTARGTPHSSGRIFVDEDNDGNIEIAVHFHIEHLEKEAK